MRRNGPRTELYLRSDISGVVRAINQAGAGLPVNYATSEGVYYRAGFNAALRAVALAFDLDIPEIRRHEVTYHEPSGTRMLTDGKSD